MSQNNSKEKTYILPDTDVTLYNEEQVKELLTLQSQQIIELVESKKIMEVSLPGDDPRVLMWKRKHNKTLDDLLADLKNNK